MRFVPVVLAALTLASGTSAWTKDRNGVWTANNNWYSIRGDRVHEACTRMNSEETHVGPCAYFTNNSGNIFRGHCAIILGHDHSEIHCR